MDCLISESGAPSGRTRLLLLPIQSPDGRPITDLASFDEKLGRFLDLAAPGQVNVEAATRLSSLKRELRARLARTMFTIYRKASFWRTDLLTVDHIGALPGTLEACLNLEAAPRVTTLCRDVWNRLSKTILAEIDRLEQQDPLQPRNRCTSGIRSKARRQ